MIYQKAKFIIAFLSLAQNLMLILTRPFMVTLTLPKISSLTCSYYMPTNNNIDSKPNTNTYTKTIPLIDSPEAILVHPILSPSPANQDITLLPSLIPPDHSL